jgi:hypothetical protein
VVDDALGLGMKDGADLEVAFEFAKGIFDFEEVFKLGVGSQILTVCAKC